MGLVEQCQLLVGGPDCAFSISRHKVPILIGYSPFYQLWHFVVIRSVYLIGTVSFAEVDVNMLAVIRDERFKWWEQATAL